MTADRSPVTSGPRRAGTDGSVEVLDHEPASTSRRSKVVLGVLVLLLVGLGVLDRRAHGAEAGRVEECHDAASAALVLADRRVSSMASYVFPALSGAYMPEVREGLAGLVGGAAEQAAGPVTAARASCAAVDVRRWHGDLREQRDACVETLDRRLGWLEEVQEDGTEAFRSAPASGPGCRAA